MEVILTPKAQKHYKNLPKSEQPKIKRKIKSLEVNPNIGKKLSGELEELRVIRAWPYRIFYYISEKNDEAKIYVVSILHRQGAYKWSSVQNFILIKMEKSKNIYSFPFQKEIKVKFIVKENEAHKGPFEGAIDFSVDLGTPVLAPFEGEVVETVDINEKYGSSPKFADYLNYITIKHANNEYSQLAHLAKGSALVKVGDNVKEGQKIAVTGKSGWMTAPHLHMLVFKLAPTKAGFKGLEIRFKN